MNNQQNTNNNQQQNNIPNNTQNQIPQQNYNTISNNNVQTTYQNQINNMNNTQTEVLSPNPTGSIPVNNQNINNINPNLNTNTSTTSINPNPNMNNIGQNPNQIPNNPQNNLNQGNNNQPINNEEPEQKGGCFKQAILIIFLVSLIGFTFFLPQISSFIQKGKTKTEKEVLLSGTLSCTMEQENDTSDLTYEAKFAYIDNKLKTSSMTITLQDENDLNINEKTELCKNMLSISNTINGISVECRPSENMIIITESYDHQILEKNNLAKFTEAGGTYPEFNYQDDITKIRSQMKKNGYDCKD